MQETNLGLMLHGGTRVVCHASARAVIHEADMLGHVRDRPKELYHVFSESDLEYIQRIFKERHPEADPKLADLRTRLLAFGGSHVELPEYDDDAENILTFGQLWLKSDCIVRVDKNRPNDMHSAACELYARMSATKNIRICTGYVLDMNRCNWYSGSWCFDVGEARIISTERKQAYYGFIMTEAQSNDFCHMNL